MCSSTEYMQAYAKIDVDEKNEIIGYEYINLGKMMDAIKEGMDANEALATAKLHIDPRHE